jgi:hypothetical protein
VTVDVGVGVGVGVGVRVGVGVGVGVQLGTTHAIVEGGSVAALQYVSPTVAPVISSHQTDRSHVPGAPPLGLQAPLHGPQAPKSHVHHPQSA